MYYYELLKVMPASIFRVECTPGVYCMEVAPADIPPLAFYAERIWMEVGAKVRYLKHRECEPPVDMKEFTWIKLTAKEI